MQLTGFQFESLKIDALKTKWIVRILFVVLIFFFVFPKIYIIGDADFTSFFSFLEQYTEQDAGDLDAIQLPAFTSGNLIHIVSSLLFDFFSIIIALFYAGLFVNDILVQKPVKILWTTLKRMPTLIAMLALMLLPFLAIFVMLSPLLLFLIPMLYLSPVIIFNKKVSVMEAIFESIRLTRGYKLSIFMNVMFIYSLQWIVRFILALFLNVDSMGFILVSGFLFAYMILAIGRNMTVMYRLITSTAK